MRGDTAAVRALLAQKADVNAPQADGATALHWAVYRGDLELADLLLRAGANAKAANREGVTPLWLASVNGDAAIIGALLEAGADRQRDAAARPDAAHDWRRAPATSTAMKVLLDRGADVERQGNAARHDGADVGGRRRPRGGGQAADRARRGHQGAIESGAARPRAGARQGERSAEGGGGAGRGARRRQAVSRSRAR